METLKTLLVRDTAALSLTGGKPDNVVECKGLKFSCHFNRWMGSDRSYNESVKMYPLKKKSCPGCVECDWLREFLVEDLCDGSCLHDIDVEHGEIYEYVVTDKGFRDYETGYYEDMQCGFRKVKK